MKNKSIIFLLTVTTIVSIILIIILSNYVFELEYQILKKDDFIENSIENDSLVVQKTKEYATQINDYVQECSFTVNGKKISQKELLRIANKAINDNSKYRDTIQRFKFTLKNAKKDYGISYDVTQKGDTLYSTKNISKVDTALAYYPKLKEIENKYISTLDSLEIYKWKAKLVKDEFGVVYKIRKEGTKLISSRKTDTKADSALVLLEYFGHRLSTDEEGNWIIYTDARYRQDQRKRKRADKNNN